MQINVTGGTLSNKEREAYIARANARHPHDTVETLNIHLDGEFVDLEYILRPERFSRIRRITGYLVGDMDRWNDAKTAEESMRVKHI